MFGKSLWELDRLYQLLLTKFTNQLTNGLPETNTNQPTQNAYRWKTPLELDRLCQLLLTNVISQLTNGLPETNTNQPTSPECLLFGDTLETRIDMPAVIN